MALIAAILISLASQNADTHYIEPSTSIAFSRTLVIGDLELELTGADRRRELGKNAYAVAHYAVPPEEELSTASEWLDTFVATSEPKVIVLKGSYPKVPARGIRWAWKRGLKRAGLENGELLDSFVKRFDEPFREGDELIFDATDPEKLVVQLNGEPFGVWNDRDLCRAVWEICLGEDADVVERQNMVNQLLTDSDPT